MPLFIERLFYGREHDFMSTYMSLMAANFFINWIRLCARIASESSISLLRRISIFFYRHISMPLNNDSFLSFITTKDHTVISKPRLTLLQIFISENNVDVEPIYTSFRTRMLPYPSLLKKVLFYLHRLNDRIWRHHLHNEVLSKLFRLWHTIISKRILIFFVHKSIEN